MAEKTTSPEPLTSNAPGEVGSWETDFDVNVGTSNTPAKPALETPEIETPENDAPAPSPEAKPDPKPAAKKPELAPAPKPSEGRKSKLDPDSLLSAEGVDDVVLPKEVVEELGKLDARNLRLQAAKLAQHVRAIGAKLKERDKEIEAARAPREDPEKQALAAEKERLVKAFDKAQEELRYAQYLRSDDYAKKFQEPFQQGLTDAYETVRELTIENAEDGTTRQAQPKDFDALLELPRGEAIRRAKAQFGDLADEVMSHVRNLTDIKKRAARASEEYRQKGEEINKERLAQQVQMRELQNKVWMQTNQELPRKYPELFGEDPNDKEGNEILAKGYLAVDKAHDATLPLEDRIARQAYIRHRAAALGRELFRRKRAEAKVAELQAIIDEYESSKPGLGASDGGKPPAKQDGDDPFAEIDAMAQDPS